MVLDTLVQNYYERRGNFDGISNTSISKALLKIEQKTGWKVNDICYFMLGYLPLCGKTASQVAADRTRYGQGDKTVTEGYSCTSMKQLGKMFKMSQFPKQRNMLGKCHHSNLVMLASEFYRDDLSNIIQLPNNVFSSFPTWLLTQTMPAKSLVNLDYVRPCLLNFKYKEGASPIIYGKTLYSSEVLTEQEQEEINVKAVEIATMQKDIFHKWAKLPVMDVILMNQNLKAKYLELLDLCRSIGITYADAMYQIGIKVPDLFTAYDYTGFLFLSFEQGYLVQEGDMESWYSAEQGVFIDMLSNTKLKGVFFEDSFINKILQTKDREMAAFS